MNPTNYSEDFQRALHEWRISNGVAENDAVLLLLDLFRIHQLHWDRIRGQELPSFLEFRESLQKLSENAATFRANTAYLIEELRRHKGAGSFVPPTVTALLLAILFALTTGTLVGKFLL